jgi:hypothetical protein
MIAPNDTTPREQTEKEVMHIEPGSTPAHKRPDGTILYAGAPPADAEAAEDVRCLIYAAAIKVTCDQKASHDIANNATYEVVRRLSGAEGV